ncbi:hypothetical protein E5A73_20455 [Sphingomonas gei]|uniref:Uncharacterized protein n=1 Tax=Sphingomonas gei TaxID=1395960 RepID=A0A4S1WYQ1_9SPHN|nr:hypothetical protein [Sphingomonas gei]TGX48681.1 hypothetical protein E5A73_20455 [Sphingomonas gei]
MVQRIQNGNDDVFINQARPVTVKETCTRYSASTIQDVSGNSRLLDLVALNNAGAVVGALTEGGVARYGSEFANG